MAYLTADLNLVAPNVGANRGGSVWSYINADDDTAAAMRAADFVADGEDKGMAVNDQVITHDDSGVGLVLIVASIAASGAVTLT